jgi:hypothetical protein
VITLKILREVQPGGRSGMDDLRASLEFFPEVIGEKIVVGQDRGMWLGVEMVIQLSVQSSVACVWNSGGHSRADERMLLEEDKS